MQGWTLLEAGQAGGMWAWRATSFLGADSSFFLSDKNKGPHSSLCSTVLPMMLYETLTQSMHTGLRPHTPPALCRVLGLHMHMACSPCVRRYKVTCAC